MHIGQLSDQALSGKMQKKVNPIGGIMNRDINIRKTGNLLFYLVIGLVPLILIPIDGKFQTAWTKLGVLTIISLMYLFYSLMNRRTVTFMENTVENRFLLGYFVLMAVSVFFSLDPLTSLVGSGYRHDGLLAFILYFFAYLIARNAKQVGKVMFPLITLTSVIIALYGILQFYKIDPVPRRFYSMDWVGLAYSTMGNPNFLGTYLVLSIPVPIYLYFYKGKKYGLLAYSILFLCLLCTRTRGAWIGAFVSLLAFLILHQISMGFKRGQWKKVAAVLVSTLLVMVFFVVTSGDVFLSRLFSIFIDFSKIIKDDETAYLGGSYRVYVWGKVLELIRMRPVFGFGIDVMYMAMNMYFREQIIADFGRYRNWDKAHNEFLNIAVSSGVFSLLAYLGFLFFLLKKAFRRMKGNPAFVPLLAAVIGYLTQAMFNIQVVMVYYVFFAYLGVLSSEHALEEEEKQRIFPETAEVQ